jgi:hypothetical protein
VTDNIEVGSHLRTPLGARLLLALVLTCRHARSQDERLDGVVGLDVIVTEKRDHLATRYLLAFVGPRPVYSLSSRTIALEMAAAMEPVGR